jgi:predicted alpha-1,2-mannosidase
VAVSTTSGRFCGSQGTYRVHVVLRLGRPMVAHGTWGGSHPGGWVTLDRTGGVSKVQVGVSFVDVAGARRNLDAERPGWSYPTLKAQAGAVWARELGRVTTTGGTATERTLLDTALYHSLLHPTTVSDADGRYPGFDGRVHRLPPGERQYSAIAGWDAYRTHLPLLAWLRPDVASGVVRSLKRMADQGGWLPRWPLVASYTGIMNGDSAAPVVAAAHAFGARDFPLAGVVAQLVRQAEWPDGAPGQGWFQPRPGLADYVRLGYVPNTTPERGWTQPHGASTTLEYAVDDFAVSRLAAAVGLDEAAARLGRRSGSWRHLLSSDRGYLLPRDAAGAFPVDGASVCCDGFQEGTASQYTWGGVPQDMGGLLAGAGPRDDVLRRLDTFHSALNAGAGHHHAWLGNQPSFLTPWAYLWLGEPTRTQDVVARARRELWSVGPGGLPGNEDLGSLSAWYVWTSLGLYPLTPGTADVGLTVPAFGTVTVRPSSGAATVIERQGSGAHIGAVLVDGVPRTASWLDLAPAPRPGHVLVVTTDDPAPAWGTTPADVPPSYAEGVSDR